MTRRSFGSPTARAWRTAALFGLFAGVCVPFIAAWLVRYPGLETQRTSKELWEDLALGIPVAGVIGFIWHGMTKYGKGWLWTAFWVLAFFPCLFMMCSSGVAVTLFVAFAALQIWVGAKAHMYSGRGADGGDATGFSDFSD